jgi:hypothetical protein
MASKTTPNSILVAFAIVYWNPKDNHRSQDNYGNETQKSATKESLADKEWVANYPVPVYAIDEEGKKACLAERTLQWEELKKATSPDGLVQKAVFERLYLDEKGKLVEPQYYGNAGFRRASQYFPAMVERFKREQAIGGLVPVIVKHYESKAERLIDQQLENELQGVGSVPMTMLDRLRVTKELFEEGCLEVAVRKLYTATTGQKLFGICVLDRYWPKLRVYDRLFLPADHVDYIPINKLRHDALVQMNNRKEADDKRKAGRPMTDKERGMTPIDEAEVEKYLSDQKKAGEEGQSKMMSKKDIEQGSKTHRIGFVKAGLQSVIDNSMAAIAPYLAFSDSLNLHKELIDTGRGVQAAAALLLCSTNDSAITAMQKAKDAGKLEDALKAVDAVLNPSAPAPVAPPASVAPPVNDNGNANAKPAAAPPAPPVVTSGKGSKRS